VAGPSRLYLASAEWLFRALGRSQRLRVVGDDPFAQSEPFVAALWHNTMFLGLGVFRDRGLVVAASRTRAGDRSSALLTRLGYGPTVRGSSSRQPVAALAGMIRAARGGHSVAVTVDGGRGPAGIVRPGVLGVARASGRAIWPIGLAARPCPRVRSSWESVLIPIPFARVVMVTGKPLRIAREADRDAVELTRLELERALHEATREAERIASREAEQLARKEAD
jgi:lysophospholipid acyltransferase (LPLAT)-like uncharacterized protein